MDTDSITIADVHAAAARIKGFANRTPVMTCNYINQLTGKELYFKCEQFQKVGAFKFRGACNAVRSLSDEEAAKGVVTHSSGNHAQALALAAQLRGIPAYVVMPENAPSVKRNAVKDTYKGTIIECESTSKARESTCERVMQETGATFIAPYDNKAVMAGQGTMALELLEDVPDLDVIVAPVGGGGMMSGICIGAKGTKPDIKLFGAEPKGADDAARSLEAGHIIPQTNPQTIADGLRTSLGELTFPIIRKYLEGIITVEEDEIRQAMKLIWERMKIVTEPSSAVPLAAVLRNEFQERTKDAKKIGIILGGGNVDFENWKWN